MSRSASSDGTTGSPAPSASSGGGVASTDYIPKPKPKGAKPPNVFSNDGSFLDRIRRSMKEEEDKKKEKEALERKKHFADRFKTRGKRPPPTSIQSAASDTTTPETDESPTKKLKLDGELGMDKGGREEAAQAEYHKAMESYPGSLKDGGTGVRPLIK
ncbi:hypothetical protein JR316_0007368 [Psilocybe cubensis]|uniref:Uncharacterized protein n=2 Tax=Psilocybe cubensis TaxID=181762 RepID=A0ACB8GYE8_PSICU|nr:hypothetical protein JR316_0007368 [Psilocybe cubensis]KAH9480768.1 hypothetical protein JR316_0007368 [Psilocybe cubensis]